MKQFIVLAAVLPLLMIFTSQIVFDQRTSTEVGQVQAIVYAAKEQAKQDGYFTKENIQKMKNDIAFFLDISGDEIIFIGDDDPNNAKERFAGADARKIYYRVEVPIKNVMAGASFLGLSKEENEYTLVIDSYTASEKI